MKNKFTISKKKCTKDSKRKAMLKKKTIVLTIVVRHTSLSIPMINEGVGKILNGTTLTVFLTLCKNLRWLMAIGSLLTIPDLEEYKTKENLGNELHEADCITPSWSSLHMKQFNNNSQMLWVVTYLKSLFAHCYSGHVNSSRMVINSTTDILESNLVNYKLWQNWNIV